MSLASTTLPAWQASLVRSLNYGGTQRQRKRTDANRKHVQIATVDGATGRPSVRTVVFRGWLPNRFLPGFTEAQTSPDPKGESCSLMFVTDKRSAKYEHIAAGAGAPVECCWWLSEAGVQYRIAGEASVSASGTAAADFAWERLSDGAKRTFSWPNPGEAVGGTAAGEREEEGRSNFVLLTVNPSSVDELHLGGSQKRILHEVKEGAWQEAFVNP